MGRSTTWDSHPAPPRSAISPQRRACPHPKAQLRRVKTRLQTPPRRATHRAHRWRVYCWFGRTGQRCQRMQLRQCIPVLGTVRPLLRSNDIFESRNPDAYLAVEYALGVVSEILVTTPVPIAVWHVDHHVQVASVGAPVGYLHTFESARIESDRQCGCFLVGHPFHAQSGVELLQCMSKRFEVLSGLEDQAVAIAGDPLCAIDPSSAATDDQVLDAMAIEYLDNSGEVRLDGRRQDPSPGRHGASGPLDAVQVLQR